MDKQKYESLVTENINLVHMCANKFRDKGIEYDDLFSSGCIGLCGAAKRFDETRGISFSTFAVPAILGEIKRCFRDGGEIKVSRQMKDKIRELKRVQEEIEESEGHPAKVHQIAEKMNISDSDVAEILGASLHTVTYDSVLVKDEGFENDSCTKTTVSSLLSTLSPFDRKIIELRYMCDMTQNEIGKALGVSQVKVSRSEKNSLSALRLQLTHDPYFN